MDQTPKNVSDDQEIDLGQISRKIGRKFQNLIFSCIQFFIKNAIVIILLIIVGAGLGYSLDKSGKTYDHQIIVKPNFQSTDYLYGKINLINAKIKEKDTVFLKSMGLEYPGKIFKIKIEPVIDPYLFVRYEEKNFELLKLIAADSDMTKTLKDNVTSKNYTYHLISFTTKEKITNENTINPLLEDFSNSDYFKILQKQTIENLIAKIQANDQTLAQIDAILNSFSNTTNTNIKNDKLIYYNENSQLDDILKTKYELVSEQGNRKIEMLNYDKIIKDISIISNIKNTTLNILILPCLLVFLYISIVFFIRFYKSRKLKYKNSLT